MRTGIEAELKGSRVGCAELAVESGLKGTHREPLLIQLLEVMRLHNLAPAVVPRLWSPAAGSDLVPTPKNFSCLPAGASWGL